MLDESEEWQKKYHAYLKSPEWQRRREKVIRRANGVCESCLDATATECHHDTILGAYRYLGNEPAYVLRALCEPCHSSITLLERQKYSYTKSPAWNQEQDRRRRYGIAVLMNVAADVRRSVGNIRGAALHGAWWKILGYRDAVPEDESRAVLTNAAEACGLSESEIVHILQ